MDLAKVSRQVAYLLRHEKDFFDKHGLRIRANQGHSVPVEVEMTVAEPPEILYHGTASRFLDSIFKEGLRGQTRLFVHLSWDVETARKVGSRHGKPVVLKVAAGQMYRDGYEFLLSENQVWQTKAVPVRYIEGLWDTMEERG